MPEIKELEELEDLDVSSLKPKSISAKDAPKHDRHHKRTNSSNEDSVKKIDLDKEALLRMLSAKVKHTNNPDAHDIASALEIVASKEPHTRLSIGKKSNSAPKLINSDDEVRRPRSKEGRRRKDSIGDSSTKLDEHVTTPRGEETSRPTSPLVPREASPSKSNRSSGERRQAKNDLRTDLYASPERVLEPDNSWDAALQSKRKSDPNFWENAIKIPSSSSSTPSTPSQDAPPPPFQDSPSVQQAAPTRPKVKPPKLEIPSVETESRIDDISNAIEQLASMTTPEQHKPRHISRTASSWYSIAVLYILVTY